MTLIASSVPVWSDLVKHEYEPSIAFCRTVVTKDDDTVALPLGTVLGKITATGKYTVAKETATDGSKVAAAVVLEDQTAYGNKDKALVMVRGAAILSKKYLVLDATYDDADKKQAVYDALESKNILINETV